MATLPQLMRAAEDRRKAAERLAFDKKNDLKRYMQSLRDSGVPEHEWTQSQIERGGELYEVHRSAVEQLKGVEGELRSLREIEVDEAEQTRLASITYPTEAGLRMNGGPSTEHRLEDLAAGKVSPSALYGAGSTSTGPAFRRASDGRPAAIARDERFGDNAIVREDAGKWAERDRIVEGTHGNLGQLVRSLSTTSGASAMVPTAWSNSVIDRARNAAVVMQAGATLVPMDSKVVQIPRLTTDPSPVFRTEGSAVTATDPALDFIQLTATSLSAITVCSLELLQDASNASEVVSNALGEAMALEIDKAALFGQLGATGTNDEGAAYGLASPYPKGVLKNLLDNASGQVVGFATNGTAQTAATPWNELLAAYYQVKTQNEVPAALVSNDKLVQQYQSMYDSTFQPLRRPMVLDPLPWLTSNVIPSYTRGTMTSRATDVFIGDFSQVLIGQRMGLEIRVLTERYAELGQVGLLAYWRGDVQVARPKGLAVYRALQGA